MKHIGLDLANDESKIGVTYTPEQWHRAKALEEAMQGIEDPEFFVKVSDTLAKLHRESGKSKTYETRRTNALRYYRKARGPTPQTKKVED